LAHHLAQEGHRRVTGETIRRHLRDLGFCIVRPVLSLGSPDPDYNAKVEYLEELKAQVRRGEIILLFDDEADLNLLPGIIGCWTRREQQRRVPTPGQNQKRYGFGAPNFMAGQVTRLIGERKNRDHFCALVEQVVQDYCPGETWQGPKVVIVADNYVIHRSKKTNQVLEGYADRLMVALLPTYSPKLNVIELLRKYPCCKVTHNHLFDSIDALVEAVEDFLAGLDSHPAEVFSVIGCSDQLLWIHLVYHDWGYGASRWARRLCIQVGGNSLRPVTARGERRLRAPKRSPTAKGESTSAQTARLAETQNPH
jgi:hypothetical protein